MREVGVYGNRARTQFFRRIHRALRFHNARAQKPTSSTRTVVESMTSTIRMYFFRAPEPENATFHPTLVGVPEGKVRVALGRAFRRRSASWATMTEAEVPRLRKPTRPRGCRPEERSLIAHNNRGELIGFEDYDAIPLPPERHRAHGGFSD